MILRKPYAILIKYFKTIHIVMFVFFGYLVFALRKIYMFFASYIETSNFTYIENMSSIYVPWILFFIVVVLLGLSIGILFLMNKKQKPVLFYKIMIGYCTLLLGVFIYYAVFFKSLDTTVYEPLKIVANRDIILFVYIFNFFFVAFSFIRGFGFDIKKFSFDKDRRELNLEESDSEEYELSVTIEKDDVKSFINRHKRELSYYVKENKTILLTILIITVVSLSLYFYYDIFVINKIYKQGDSISVGNLTYRVDSSIISGVDKYGQIIGTEYDYLVIKMNITNEYDNGQLDPQALRVNVDEEYYYPITSLCDLYTDLGKCYSSQDIKPNTDNIYIFAYKIKKEHKIIYLEILRNKGDEYQYSRVKLSYEDARMNDRIYEINSEFEINGNKLSVNKYSLLNKDSYEYEECNGEVCNKYTKVVIPKVGEAVLSFELSGVDSLSDDFLKSAIGIKYNDKVYTGKTVTFLAKNNNMLYYSVPSFLKGTNNFYLLITTRATRYNIEMEGNK